MVEPKSDLVPTLVRLSRRQMAKLDRMAKARRVSRAAMLRALIDFSMPENIGNADIGNGDHEKESRHAA